MFKKAGVLNENKIMGVTTLGVIRASTFVAEEKVMISVTSEKLFSFPLSYSLNLTGFRLLILMNFECLTSFRK